MRCEICMCGPLHVLYTIWRHNVNLFFFLFCFFFVWFFCLVFVCFCLFWFVFFCGFFLWRGRGHWLYSHRPSVIKVCTRNSSYILHRNSYTAVWIDYIWKSICHFELRIFPLSSLSIRHTRLSVQLLIHFNWEFLKTRHAF